VTLASDVDVANGISIRGAATGAVQALVTTIGSRRVVLVRTDPVAEQKFLSANDGVTLGEAARDARRLCLPLVGVIASTGASMQDGVSALDAWGSAAKEIVRCAGTVPVIIIVDGPAVSGVALVLGLADIVIMTERALAYVSGVRSVEKFTGHRVEPTELGGPAANASRSGVATTVVPDLQTAYDHAELLLSFLPSHASDIAPRADLGERVDPIDRRADALRDVLPATPSGSYDVRNVITEIVDDADFVELRQAWAPSLVTGFARIDGYPVGIIANQPVAMAGTLDIPSSQKGARFVSFCDAFNVPILSLVDTPGFYPGKDLEWRGMIRHGAQLAFAYAAATVPRLAVVLRKAYGGAYIVMDCKSMGNDFCAAWPTAEIAVMGAQGAVQILHRDVTDESQRQSLLDAYETELLNPYVAAERGFVDIVIDPCETRRVLGAALDLLITKAPRPHRGRHTNTPQ